MNIGYAYSGSDTSKTITFASNKKKFIFMNDGTNDITVSVVAYDNSSYTLDMVFKPEEQYNTSDVLLETIKFNTLTITQGSAGAFRIWVVD